MANILIVDDDPGVRQALARIVELEEHAPFAAGGGVEALEVLHANDIDLAFVDLAMPEMDGVELMRRVREAYPGIRLVPMSAARELLTAPSEYTAAECLTKPFAVEDVREVLRQAFDLPSTGLDGKSVKPKAKREEGSAGPGQRPQFRERRRDHVLREKVKNLLGDVRGLHGKLHVMDNEEVEAAQRRFLKYSDMIWDRLLEGEETEE